MTDDLIGKQIGGYEVLSKLGQGGMATVYRAKQQSMNRVVALKILPRHFVRDDSYLQRFEREVRIVSQLEHRNIVPVYDYGEYDLQPYIAMRHMSGGSVDDLLKKGFLDLDTILKFITQIAPALDYAHTKNVLHRDLKPSNILLDDDGGAYITDFGIARIVGVEGKGDTITTQGVVGTPSYMSPEQAQGQTLDGRSDVYALGIMLFEMATGRRPFQNETPYSIAVMQVTTPPPVPRSINPQIPGSVEQVILKALKKQPQNRYQTAVQLAEALRLSIENPGSAAHDTQPRGVPIKSAMEVTQPSSVPSGSNQQTVPSPPLHPPQSVVGMPSPPTPRTSAQVSAVSQLQYPVGWRGRVQQRRKRGNIWVSVIIGGLIGCALLTAIVAVVLLAVNDFLEGTVTPAGATLAPDALSTRQALLDAPGGSNDTDATPVFTNVTPIPSRTPELETSAIAPIGSRPTATFDPDADFGSGDIIYFAQRDDDFDIFRYNLRSGVEQPLTIDHVASTYPAVSLDGGRMTFQSDLDGDFDIYVMDLNIRSSYIITENDTLDRLPAWSPDGVWVIYSSDTRGDGNLDLYRVPSIGGEPELVLSNGRRNSHAQYSNDGRFIVYTSGEAGDASTWEIFKLDMATGDISQITNNFVRDASPTYSPDGSTILFVTDGEGGAAIATIDADGDDDPAILYDGEGYEWGMHYNPDGSYILFNEERDGISHLFMMRSDGGGLRELENGGGYYPVWVP
jgi:serine/threonine-protein kinase